MLWIFGDSFSVPPCDFKKLDYKLWSELLAEELTVDCAIRAQYGVSNEYILASFTECLEHNYIKDTDLVIIQLTTPLRQWMIKDKPHVANYYVTEKGSDFTKDEQTAINYFIKYLDYDKPKYVSYYWQLYGLVSFLESQPFRALVLPGFEKIPNINGTLLEICDGEFVDTASRDKWYNRNEGDTRPNHLSPENHKILVEKIANFFKTGLLPDLSVGFQEKFL